MENNSINFCSNLLILSSIIFLGSLHLQQGANRNPQASLVWAHQESVITSIWSVILLFFSDPNPAFLSGKFSLILPVFHNRIRIRRIRKFFDLQDLYPELPVFVRIRILLSRIKKNQDKPWFLLFRQDPDQLYGSMDPDPNQNITDSEHWIFLEHYNNSYRSCFYCMRECWLSVWLLDRLFPDVEPWALFPGVLFLVICFQAGKMENVVTVFSRFRFTFDNRIFYLQTVASTDSRYLYSFVQMEGTKVRYCTCVQFKGTVFRDRFWKCWHKLTDLGLNKGRVWFLNFSEAPLISIEIKHIFSGQC